MAVEERLDDGVGEPGLFEIEVFVGHRKSDVITLIAATSTAAAAVSSG